MANEKTRLYNLPEVAAVNSDMYLMLDSSTTGARKYNLKTLYDKVDGVQASAQAATTAATAATAAAESANTAATTATQAATSAGETVAGLVEDVDEALDAIEDISELAVPLMSPTTRGGAKLGTGLEISDGTLSVNTVSSGDGSQAGPILSLSAKGWAEQDSTTGKNLLYHEGGAQQVRGGVTFTRNADGSVTASGTSTANYGSAYYVICEPDETELQPLKGKAVTFSTHGVDLSNYVMVVLHKTASNPSWSLATDPFTSSATFTVASDITGMIVRVAAYSANTSTGGTIYPQLELGSVATEYEPYSGGAPSPSPDYAQEIRVCRGRNLLNEDAYEHYDIYISDGHLATNASANCMFAEVEQGETYAVSRTWQGTSTYYYYGFFASTPQDSSLPLSYGTIPSNNWSVTAPSGAKYVGIFFGSGKSVEPQLERGSVVHPYVHYGDYVGLEAQGKNLFGGDFLLSSIKGAMPGATLSGRTISYTGSNTQDRGAWFSDFKANTQYTFVIDKMHTAAAGSKFNVVINYTDGTTLEPTNVAGANTRETLVIVTAANKTVRDIRGIWHSGTLTIYADGCGIFEGVHTIADFEPYYHTTTPIPLPSRGWVASLPDGTADTLTLDGAGKVTWERKTNEITFDGSESDWFQENSNRRMAIHLTTNALSPAGNKANGLCTRFRASTAGDTWWGGLGFAFTTTLMYFADGTNDMVVADWKTWLSTHPVTVLYPLATPVTEERGYVEMPSVPVGAELRIPELDDLGVRYCVDDAASELARMWYERARSEYADELMELRMTVAELATRMS